MKRILSLIFVVLTMSVMMFAEEMPKEVNFPSDELSLSENNEMLYDGKLYTGKIILDDVGYMNLKDGHLEGKTYMGGGELKISFNIVNDEFDGDFIEKGKVFGTYIDMLINFRNGKIKTWIASIGAVDYDLTFDSSGNANGTLKSDSKNIELNFIDGVAKTKEGLIVKGNSGDKGNEMILSTFTKSGKLISESGRGYHMNRNFIEGYLFQPLLGEISDEQIEFLEKTKKKLEESK